MAVFLRLELAGVMSAVFISSMMALIGSLVFFIVDVNQSLSALTLELRAKAKTE